MPRKFASVPFYPRHSKVQVSNHQHYPSLRFDEGIRVAHYNGIYLGRGDRLTILSNVQSPAVDNFRDLFGPQASAPLCKYIQYGFLDFHCQSFDEMLTNSTFPSI